jgi:hypothetical protein
MPFDPTQTLGKSIVNLVRDGLLSVFGTPPDNEIIEDCIYSTFHDEGFGLIADLSGAVVSVQMYSDGLNGLKEYRQSTPGNLQFSDNYRCVRSKLGNPSASAGEASGGGVAWDRFDFKGFSIHVEYKEGGKAVQLITASKMS